MHTFTDRISPKARRTMLRGQAFIKTWEGFRLSPYEDIGGARTVYWGHKMAPGEDLGGDRREAERVFKEDLATVNQAIHALVKVPLSQGEFDALASFIYNVGRKAFEKSTMRKKLNAGDYDGAASEFMRWVHVQGKEIPGLVKRRQAEMNLFLKG